MFCNTAAARDLTHQFYKNTVALIRNFPKLLRQKVYIV